MTNGKLGNYWAYIFITTREPRMVLQAIRKLSGVLKVEALFGTPDVIAIVLGDSLASMDQVIHRIVEVPHVLSTDSKVARWIDQNG
jgi:hypothetical protein